LISCNNRNNDNTVILPATSPLTREYIGFGVITSSFTHLNSEPSEESPSFGYIRRGSLVKIIKRQTVRTPDGFVTWVLTDEITQGNTSVSGWLKEEVMDIFTNENQAKTASESMTR